MYFFIKSVYDHFGPEGLELLEKNPVAKKVLRNLVAGEDSKGVRKSVVKTLDLPLF